MVQSPQNPHFGGLNNHFKTNMRKIQIANLQICVSDCMKFDRQLHPATETSWVVSYGGKTIPRWQMAAIFKIDISPYLSEKIIRFSWNFVHSSVFWTGWTSRDQKWKSCIGQTPCLTERISCYYLLLLLQCLWLLQLETCKSEISVRIESRIESAATIWIESRMESADSRLQLQC